MEIPDHPTQANTIEDRESKFFGKPVAPTIVNLKAARMMKDIYSLLA